MKRFFAAVAVIGLASTFFFTNARSEPVLLSQEEVWKKEAIEYVENLVSTETEGHNNSKEDVATDDNNGVNLNSEEAIEMLKSNIRNSKSVLDVTNAALAPIGPPFVMIDGKLVGNNTHFIYHSPDEKKIISFGFTEQDSANFYTYLSVVLNGDKLSISNKNITVSYMNIGLSINGEEIAPKDINGRKVEPFIYEGTTYVPIRAISEALGKTVEWDNATKTVVIGDDIQIVEGQIYVRSSNPVSLDTVKLIKSAMTVEEVIDLLGYPHEPALSSTLMDSYILLDGKKLTLNYGMYRDGIEQAFISDTEGKFEIEYIIN